VALPRATIWIPLLAEADVMELQSQESFAAALLNASTSQSFILITVIDDSTHTERTGCVTANLLIGAILIETNQRSENKAQYQAMRAKAVYMALAAPRHTFHFSNPTSIANIRFDERGNEKAYELIRQGHSAFRACRSGRVMEGQPGSSKGEGLMK
jgi:hypothetical protein